jgi:hypothetical protein
VFAAALVLTIIAFTQSLRPVISIINSQKRVAGILTTADEINALLAETRPYKKFALIFSAMYFPAILFFLYMIVLQIWTILHIKMPKLVLPLLSAVNTILLLIVLFSVNNIAGGLGLSPKHEVTANYFSWYTAPVFANDSNIYYFAPTFYTVIMPLLFFGLLPFIYGIKCFFPQKQVVENQHSG